MESSARKPCEALPSKSRTAVVLHTVWLCLLFLTASINVGAQDFTVATINSTAGSQGNLVQGTDGNFYGTTFSGGVNGQGSVFKITPGGALTTLYSFCSQPNCTDGASPYAGLVQGTDGNFYGTTSAGGANGGGTVFVTVGSTLTFPLYSFCSQSNCADGSLPEAALVQGTDGNFYGTTESGGANDVGVVFDITAGGTLTPLYSFCFQSGCTVGFYPFNAGLVQGTDGNFYGTTTDGVPGVNYQGTVFKITPGGNATPLYSFCSQFDCPDGAVPAGGLVQGTDGNFYGTTTGGGAKHLGVVFKIAPSGAPIWFYSFGSQSGDGAYPLAPLAQGRDGNFYGTTPDGGTNDAGTVFKITPDGTLTTLYNFCSQANCADGGEPQAGLIEGSDGYFYGTTTGTVFKLIPVGNGVDVSRSAEDVADSSWQDMMAAGIQYVVVGAWGGKTQNPYAEDQLLDAQIQGLMTGGYAVLNYLSNGGSGSGQIAEAVAAIGRGIHLSKFVAVDVEPCCGEFQSWQPSHQYAVAVDSEAGSSEATLEESESAITDPAGHIQTVVRPGTSNASPPAWNDSGGETIDGTIVWRDTGSTVINQKARVQRIEDAVAAIQAQHLHAVIYADWRSWRDITGNCGNGTTNNCASLIALPLWDNEHRKLTCGDAIVGLTPFHPYTPFTWQTRSGNQFDYGSLPSCSGVQVFGTTLDLDYFDPVLFQ